MRQESASGLWLSKSLGRSKVNKYKLSISTSADLHTHTHTHTHLRSAHLKMISHTLTLLCIGEKKVTKTQYYHKYNKIYSSTHYLKYLVLSQQNNHHSLNSHWESVLNLPCNTSEHTYRLSGDKVSFVDHPAGINWAQVTGVRANALSMPCNTHYFDLQASTGSVHMYAEYDSACKKSDECTHCLTAPLRNICALNITKYMCILPSSLKPSKADEHFFTSTILHVPRSMPTYTPLIASCQPQDKFVETYALGYTHTNRDNCAHCFCFYSQTAVFEMYCSPS